MPQQNIKVYLAISGALIILLILVLVIPFSKKTSPQKTTTPPSNQPFPTSVVTNPSPVAGQADSPTPITVKADFTGAIDDKLPQQVIDLAAQKKDLRSKVPLNLTTFAIDFDYSSDKFVVALFDPKAQAQKEFESWRVSNYSALNSDQFLLR